MVLSTHDLNLAAALCRRLILLRGGRVIAQGPTDEVLTPDSVRALYGVEADVQRHPAAGHLTVTPIARVPLMPPIRRRLVLTIAGFGLLLLGGARHRPADWIDAHLARARLRSLDPVRRQHRRADLLHRAAAAGAGRGAGRRGAGRGRRRLPGAAAQSAGDARHARRLERRRARRDAGDHLSLQLRRSPASPRFRSPASPARSARSASSTRWRRRGAAASRRSCCCSPASR